MATPLYCVYRHIRPDKNEPFYVGIAKEGNGRPRDKRRNDYWLDIVNSNDGQFEVEEVLNGLSLEQACQKEIEFIALYGRIPEGTGILANILPGGEIGIANTMTEDTKKLLAKRMTGNEYAKGYSHTPSARECMRASKKGNTYSLGYKHTEQTRKLQSKAHEGNSSHTGKMCITNGVENKFIPVGSNIPDDWRKGSKRHYFSTDTRKLMSEQRTGRKLKLSSEQLDLKKRKAIGNKGTSGKGWITDGVTSRYLDIQDVIPTGWRKGRTRIIITDNKL